MPRYVVERTFDGGLNIPVDADGAATCLAVVGRNADEGVTWIHSYVTGDKSKTFCVYDAPTPEAIRKSAITASPRPAPTAAPCTAATIGFWAENSLTAWS